MTDKEREKIKTTYLTPCRSVGLKRKSLGSNVRKSVETITPKNSPNKPEELVEKRDNTPKRPLRSSFSRKQPLSKKFKSDVNNTSVIKVEDNDPVIQLKPKELRNDSILQHESEKNLDNNLLVQKPKEFQSNLELQPVSEELQQNENILDIDAEISKTKESIVKKKDEIKRLESDSLNSKQHDLQTLNILIKKWRTACQQALTELHTEYTNRGKSGSMSVLLNTLGIPPELVRYSDTEMDFYEL